MSRNLTSRTLSSDSFWMVNKYIAKKVGLNAAILLADLTSKEQYFLNKNQLENDWFFNTSKNIEEDTSLTSYEQRSALKKLEKYNLIKTKTSGLPAKKYFKLKHADIISLLQ